MNNKFYVYIYYDPRNNQPFYVGKGTGARLYDHLKESIERTANKRKHYKIQSIRRDGLEPVVEKYKDNLTENEAYDLEDELIIKWGRKDFDKNGILFNIAEAGIRVPVYRGKDHYNWGKTGAMLGKKLTPEQKERQRIAQTGRTREPFSDEWLKNMGKKKKGDKNPMYGKKHSLETLEKIRIKAQDRIHSPESNEKRSETLKKTAAKKYQRIIPEILTIQQDGIITYRGIARELNNRGFKTDRGSIFRDDIVKRILTTMNTTT